MALFKAFYGLKSDIQNHEIQNGSMYIATDTKQKFVDINNQRVQISDQYMDDSVQTKINVMKEALKNI